MIMTYSIERTLKFYTVEVTVFGTDSIEINAINRHGRMFSFWMQRRGRYWECGSDFGVSVRITFRGIIDWICSTLINEVREYDKSWYDFHSLKTYEDGEEFRDITWEQARKYKDDPMEAPTFKGSLTITRKASEDN